MANIVQHPASNQGSLTRVSPPQLSSRLNAAVESDQRLSDLSADNLDRVELLHAVAGYEASLAPADTSEISRMLGKLAVLFPHSKISAEEAKAQNLLYAELLSDIPQDILSEAFRKVAQTCKFFPTVAEIRDAAGGALAMRTWRLMRLKGLLAKCPPDHAA